MKETAKEEPVVDGRGVGDKLFDIDQKLNSAKIFWG